MAANDRTPSSETDSSPQATADVRRRTRFLLSPRARWGILGSILVLALVAALLVPKAVTRRSTMGEAPKTASQLTNAKVGTAVAVALEVGEAMPDGSITGTLLDRVSGTTYRRTSQMVVVQSRANTTVAMGEQGDVQTGAVLQVHGLLSATQPLRVVADQLTILTGLVALH